MAKKETKRYAIDAQIGVWVIRQMAEEHDASIQSKAEQVFDKLNSSGHEIYIPSPVVTELLSYYIGNIEEKARIENQIRKDFIVLPFDYKSSLVCSKLLRNHYQDNVLQKYREELNIDGLKTKMKFDTMIVSIAISHNLDGIISRDKKVLKRASENNIDVLEIDTLHSQYFGAMLSN